MNSPQLIDEGHKMLPLTIGEMQVILYSDDDDAQDYTLPDEEDEITLIEEDMMDVEESVQCPHILEEGTAKEQTPSQSSQAKAPLPLAPELSNDLVSEKSLASRLQLTGDYIIDQVLDDVEENHFEIGGGYVELKHNIKKGFKHNRQDIKRAEKSLGKIQK